MTAKRVRLQDSEAPKVNSKALLITQVTSNSISIRWERATDNVSLANKIRYDIGLTEYDDPKDPWRIVRSEYGISSHTFTGLKMNTKYAFYVKAYDEAGNKLQYPVDNGSMTATTAGSTTDSEAPRVSSKALLITQVTSNSISICWEKARDNTTAIDRIRYQIGLTESGNPKDPWRIVRDQRGISSHTFTGLKKNTKYAFYVKAYDEAGNKLQYPVDNGSMTATTASTDVASPQQGGSSSNPNQSEAQRRQEIREFLNMKKNGDRLADVVVSGIEKPIKNYIVSGKEAMMLINEEHDIFNSQDDFMPINEANIYPGRLIYADRNMVNGRAADVNFYTANQVGKVTVNVNFLAVNVALSEKGVTATYDGIQAAVSKILNNALRSGALPPTVVEKRSTVSNSKEKIAVDAGCSVDYLGAKCKINTTTTKDQESFYAMESFKQGFYQVSVDVEDHDFVNYLGKGVTKQILERAWTAPIAIIKSVTYGRVGYNLKTYAASSFTFKGDESASYKSYFEATSKQDIQRSSNTANHFARIWGGSATTAGNAITTGGIIKKTNADDALIDNAFTKEMTGNMEISMKNQGVPISYTVVYLASGREVSAYLTGKYLESKYIPLVNRLSFSVKQEASVLYGTNSVEMFICYKYFCLDANGNRIGRIYTGEYNYKWSNKSPIERVIELPSNCYFLDNEVEIICKSRRAASAGLNKWKVGSRGYVNITGGKLKIKLVGSYYSYSVRLGGSPEDGYAQFK